jgi:L-ascorbate metabolism protein UlaG (beta-lactamase superfamily)
MDFQLTYIHHSCFALKYDGVCLLFDYPAPEHRPEGAEQAAVCAVRGEDLILVHSHGHADHFDPNPTSVTTAARSVRRIVSYDIAELSPDAITGGDRLEATPDESYEWSGMRIEAMDSNDLGCAYLIERQGLRIYYAGDLALWDWEQLPEAERAFTGRFFDQAAQRVKAYRPHAAFAVTDPRLASRGGAVRFAQTVQPEVFIPMHSFGRTDFLPNLVKELQSPKTRIFLYRQPGDAKSFHVSAGEAA